MDLARLTDQLRTGTVEELAARVEKEALGRVAPYAWRVLGVAALGALVISAVAFRRKWRSVIVAVLSALLVTGGSEAAAWMSFRPSALLSPTFSGSLALAPKLIGPARAALGRIDDFRAELDQVVGGALRVYTQIQGSPVGAEDEIRVLQVSDLHLSPLGISFAQQLAQAFDVDLVIDTGDITSFGTPAEEAVLSSIPGFGRPYVFVGGNHDSPDLRAEMARIPGAVVLDGQARTIQGLSIYGLGDPVFTPDKRAALDDAAIAGAVEAAGPRLLSDVRSMSERPDIVAVHDDRMAETLAGYVPLVVSGHFHAPGARVEDGTLFLRDGSTGGAGANVFTQAGGVPLSAEILHFTRTSPPRMVAYDVISQSPESGSLVIRRRLVQQDFGVLVPSPPPTVPPTPPPASLPAPSHTATATPS